MPNYLLLKVVNDDIKLESFKKWLLSQEKNPEIKCSQANFLTYFLNFLHEEISSQNKVDSPMKCTSQRTVPQNIEKNVEPKRLSSLDNFSTPADRSIEKSFSEGTVEVNTSTPKFVKRQSSINLNTSYCSPISPLYETQNRFVSPKNGGQIFGQKSSFCLGDFITKKSSSKKKNTDKKVKSSEESSKRITPTCLTKVMSSESFRKSSNSFEDFNIKEVPVENLNGSRDFFAEERRKILSRKSSVDTLFVSATKKVNTTNQGQEVEPDLRLVSHRNKIDKVVDIYSTILNNDLVLNITSEIYFLISLLLTKRYLSESFDDTFTGIDFLSDENEHMASSDFFNSIHNVVYFASKCLESQLEVLKHYDKSTLKLLSLNKRLQTFSAKLAEKLSRISNTKPERTVELSIQGSQTNVYFNSDTDNRDNFPNDTSFHSFRKQRDLFYEILRIWETNHVMPGWNFSIGLGSKIKTLFSLQGDAANFMHFSRLFKAQLLSTCGKSHREEGFSEDQLPFLSSLPNIDTNKLNLLKNRLVTKQVSSGLNSLPFFIGHQEFYKDFIVVAANHAFNRYLCDTFISEIIDLNDTKFICADPNESEDVVDTSTIKYFTSILSKLRIIAKFLGFVESLPYKSEVNTLSDKLLNSHISLRCQTTPSFDIKQILLHSISENTVVLTIPWMVIYLSMLDYVTLRLPYYVSMYKIFFELNRFYKPSIKNAYNYNSSLVKFSLGWLFELPHFPDTDYLNFQSSGSILFIKKTNTLDNCNIIDQNILYICCPYLEEMKKLLTNSSLHNTLTVRHITPVTARESTEVLFKKRSEHQLEEAFFNGQPGSVRKTVEFVSERIASACVKHICNSLVPASKKIALQELKVFLESWRRDDQVLTPMREKSHKAALKAKVSQMASTSLSALLKKCHEDVSAILSEKLPASIDTLLAIDSLNQTKTACVSIAARMCKERVKQWLNMHVTILIFKKYFDNEVQKVLNHESKRFVKDKLIFALPSNGNREGHNDNCLSGFHMMEKIKNLSVDVIDDSIDVDEEAILKLLQEAPVTLKERCDVNEIITAYICTSLVDFLLLLVIQRGFIMTEDILRLSMKTWVCYYGTTEDLFGNLLCPRNIMLLNQSRNQKSSWYSFSKFVAFLIKHNVISCDNFQNQCTGFFKRNWDQASLENTCYFLRSFFEFFKQNGDISKFTLLLEFYSEFCSDL